MLKKLHPKTVQTPTPIKAKADKDIAHFKTLMGCHITDNAYIVAAVDFFSEYLDDVEKMVYLKNAIKSIKNAKK